MNDDAISRSEAIRNLMLQPKLTRNVVRRVLMQTKSVNPDSLYTKAKWVYDHWCEFKCSNCGNWSTSEPYRAKENFCSNCGAKMGIEIYEE